jgi:hypothetical protein
MCNVWETSINMKISELKSLKGFLRKAHDLVTDAGELAQSDDASQAARVKNIKHLIENEIDVTGRKLADAERLEEGGGTP